MALTRSATGSSASIASSVKPPASAEHARFGQRQCHQLGDAAPGRDGQLARPGAQRGGGGQDHGARHFSRTAQHEHMAAVFLVGLVRRDRQRPAAEQGRVDVTGAGER
jgi:hypothetical protein